MMKRRSSRGYSMMEILVVLAIIGVLSLVTVPAFINFQRRNQVRSALREFTAIVRSCRQEAISNNRWIRFTPDLTPAKVKDRRKYTIEFSVDSGTTWNAYTPNWGKSTPDGYLPETMYFKSAVYPGTATALVFKEDGTMDPPGTTTIVLTTDWSDIINEITVTVNTSGQVKSTEKKV